MKRAGETRSGRVGGGASEAFELGARFESRGDRAGIVINLFFDDRAVKIVSAKAQRDLRDRGREHDPVGFDVREIIEEQARYRNVAQVGVAGGLGNVRKRGVVRVKRQWNKSDEAVSLVLKLTQLEQMIDALFFGFHVAVEHGGVGMKAEFVSLARNA